MLRSITQVIGKGKGKGKGEGGEGRGGEREREGEGGWGVVDVVCTFLSESGKQVRGGGGGHPHANRSTYPFVSEYFYLAKRHFKTRVLGFLARRTAHKTNVNSLFPVNTGF